MGKWSSQKGVLPDHDPDGDDPSLLDRIHAGMDARKGMSRKELIEEFNQRDARKDALNADVKVEEFELKVLSRCILRDLEDSGEDSVRMAGYVWTPSPEPYPKVVDKLKLRAWVDAHMPENLRLPDSTLKATVKAALDADGSGLLPDGVEAKLVTKLSRTKSKK